MKPDFGTAVRLTGNGASTTLQSNTTVGPRGGDRTGETNLDPGRGELAQPGNPLANGNNPIPIVIPCHRVLATTHIGGYSGGDGLPTKRWLLALEARAQPLLLPIPSAAA